MYTLEEIKPLLGDDYKFTALMTVPKLKHILEKQAGDYEEVPFVLEAGCLDIELSIHSETEDGSTEMRLEYYCCIRENGKWRSYGNILDKINLDVPDLEAEMFRVLDKYAVENNLRFFDREHIGTIDKCLTILSKTEDGDLLSPDDLKLTENGVNDRLSEYGLAVLDKLYEQVTAGVYKKPYFHGVEFMTNDHEGYVYFKGEHVEHYSSFWAYTLDAKNSLKTLQQYCLYLENKGGEINSVKAMFMSFDKGFAEYKKNELDSLLNGGAIVFTVVTPKTDKSSEDSFRLSGAVHTEEEIRNSPEYKDFVDRQRFEGDYVFDVCTYKYGSGVPRPASENELDVINCCYDFLQENNLLSETVSYQFESRVQEQNNDDEVDFDYDCEDEEEFEP